MVLNPLIIGTAADADGKVLGIPAGTAVTALVAAVMTFLMGVVGRYPFAIATGLGLNAFVAANVARDMSWPDAMGLVVCEGIIITLLVLTGFRTAVLHAVPQQLKTAIGVGVGLFIALIGLVDAGIVRRIHDVAGTAVPVQLIGAGIVSYTFLRTVKGGARDIHPLLWSTAALFVVYFMIDPLKTLLGVD